MKFDAIEPPRKFRPAGPGGPELSHVATVELDPDELITIRNKDGAEVDFIRKSWGFYPLPSLNDRLARFDLYPALFVNKQGRLYILLAEDGKRQECEDYLEATGMKIIAWLGDKVPS